MHSLFCTHTLHNIMRNCQTLKFLQNHLLEQNHHNICWKCWKWIQGYLRDVWDVDIGDIWLFYCTTHFVVLATSLFHIFVVFVCHIFFFKPFLRCLFHLFVCCICLFVAFTCLLHLLLACCTSCPDLHWHYVADCCNDVALGWVKIESVHCCCWTNSGSS